MKDPNVQSYIYLHAVLPLLEEIVRHDKQAQDLAKGWKCSIMLHVSNGPAVTLKFRGGECEAVRKSVALPTVAMWFSTPEKLNAMFEGAKVMPVIWKGIWHPGILKNFIALTKRLDYYMNHRDEVVQNPAELPFVVSLLAYTAVYGAKAVADNDERAKKFLVPSLQNGVVQIDVKGGGPKAFFIKDETGITVGKGAAPKAPDAFMEIKDVGLAYDVFTGKADVMASLGRRDILIHGHIPLVDGMNGLLDRLSQYVGS